jgi:ankyrin repeat protein
MCDDFERSVNEGRTRVVIAALARVGKDPNAVRWAAWNGHVEVLRLLLAWVGVDGKRVDPTANNNTAVRWAAYRNHVEVVRVLLEWVGVDGKRVDPTADTDFAVRWAACYGHVQVVRVLLAWVGVDGQRVDIEVARRAAKSPAVLALCNEAASIAVWWSPARVAWIIGVVVSS